MRTDQPTQLELDTYVDGQLDLPRKYMVENHLAQHPALAAQVMADLGSQSALKILMGNMHEPSEEMRAAASRLAEPPPRAFWRRAAPFGGMAITGMAAAVLFALSIDGPPDYVGYAVASHRTAMVRAAMASQLETPRFDAKEILTKTRIDMPVIPAGWQVTDVQLFPSNEGPALLVAVRTGQGEPLSLYAVRGRTSAPERPDAVREGAQSVAYWRRGDTSYALTGETDPVAIDATAEALARTWS